MVVGDTLLIFVGLAVCFEINQITAVFLQAQHFDNRGIPPSGHIQILCHARTVDSFASPVGQWCNDFFSIQQSGNLLGSIAVHCQ